MSFENWNKFVYETLKANGKLTEGGKVDSVKAKELINILQEIKENIHDTNTNSGQLLTTLQGIDKSLQRIVTHLDDADRRREEREVFNL